MKNPLNPVFATRNAIKTYPKSFAFMFVFLIGLAIVLYFGLKNGGFIRGENVNQRKGDTITQGNTGNVGINRDDDIREPGTATKIGDTTNTGPVINKKVDNENSNTNDRDSTIDSEVTMSSPSDFLVPSDFGAPSSSEEPASSEPPTTLAPASTEPPSSFDTGFPQSQKLNVQHFDNINTVGRKTVNFDWPTDKKLVEISFNFKVDQPLNKTGWYGIMENMRHDNSSTPRTGFGIFIGNLVPELHIHSINNVGKRESNVLRLTNVKILPEREYFFDVKLYYQTERPFEQYAVFSVETNDHLYQDRKFITVDGQNSALLPINENFVHGNKVMFGDDSCCNGRSLPPFEITDFNIELSNNLKLPDEITQGPLIEIPFGVYSRPVWMTGTNNIPYRSIDNGKTWQQIKQPIDKVSATISNNALVSRVEIATDGTVWASQKPISNSLGTANKSFRLNTRDTKEILATQSWTDIGRQAYVTPESYNVAWVMGITNNNVFRAKPQALSVLGKTTYNLWPEPYTGQQERAMRHISAKNYKTGKQVIGVGTNNLIYETTNGTYWNQLGTAKLKMIVPAPDKTLHGIGLNDRIYKSVDNGKTWQIYPSGSGKWIDVSSSGKVWIIGTNNVPYYWTGTNWVAPNPNTRALTISVM